MVTAINFVLKQQNNLNYKNAGCPLNSTQRQDVGRRVGAHVYPASAPSPRVSYGRDQTPALKDSYPLTHPTGATWCPWPPVCRLPWDSSQSVCSWLMQPSPPPMKYTPSCCKLPPCKTSRRFFTKHPSRKKKNGKHPSRAHTHHPKHRWINTHVGRIVRSLRGYVLGK